MLMSFLLLLGVIGSVLTIFRDSDSLLDFNSIGIIELKSLTDYFLQNSELSFCLFIFGLVLSNFISTVLAIGWAGETLKLKGEAILNNRFIFNLYFFLFVVFYFVILTYFETSAIRLEPSDSISVTIEGVKVEIGNLSYIAKNYGADVAFLTGLRIGAYLVSSHKMGLLPKTAATLGMGAGSAYGYTLTMDSINLYRILIYKSNLPNNISAQVQNFNIQDESKGKMKEFLDQFINPDMFSPSKVNSNPSVTPELRTRLQELKENLISNNQSQILDNPIHSKVIDEIEKTKNLASVFAEKVQGENTEIVRSSVDISNEVGNTFINSPLEPEILDLIVNILNKDLLLHFCMLSLTFSLFIIFSIKLIAERDLYSLDWQAKVKALPLGGIIHALIYRAIESWKVSSILWIYLIIFSLFIFICFSAFGVYVSLTGIRG